MAKPKPKPAPAPTRQYVNITLSITPEDAEWLAVGGNASYKAREAFRAMREREGKKR